MIRSLLGAGAVEYTVDVLVIGAGTAGLLLAETLHRSGINVLCVESGGLHQEADTHPLNEVEQVGVPYAGALHGRFRCLGGTSTRWGGALIPFAAADLDPMRWPLTMRDVQPYLARVESVFGLPTGPYELPGILGDNSSHVARLAKWPPFRRRNLATLLGNSIRARDGLLVWLNATATQFKVDAGQVRTVMMQALDGARLKVHVKHIVLACGAIESTRLLLMLDLQNAAIVSTRSPKLGIGFHDHLSAVVADVKVVDRQTLNRVAGFRFEPGGVMRNLRFELASNSLLRLVVPACFAHISFEASERSGFTELRALLRMVQRGRVPDFAQSMRLARNIPWVTKVAYWRFAEKRLLYPDNALIQLHMVIDQEVRDDNRIVLSSSKVDFFGQPLACIDWTISERDELNMYSATRAMLDAWKRSALNDIATLAPREASTISSALAAGGGIYHPCGSTRMGFDAASGVVDTELRLFAVPNVRVVSTSVFPSGGGANPTMMLLMLALRCAVHLTSTIRNR